MTVVLDPVDEQVGVCDDLLGGEDRAICLRAEPSGIVRLTSAPISPGER